MSSEVAKTKHNEIKQGKLSNPLTVVESFPHNPEDVKPYPRSTQSVRCSVQRERLAKEPQRCCRVHLQHIALCL